MAVGVLLLAVGGLYWLGTNNAAHECGSGLVHAQALCSAVTTKHMLGGAGALAGLVLSIAGLVRR